MTKKITPKKLKARPVKHEDEHKVISLLKELTEKPISLLIDDLISDANCHAIVLEDEDGEVIAFGSLVVHLVPSKGYVSRIEDIVVRESHRGQGLGDMIMEELLGIAKKREVVRVDLTSNPTRTSAHKFYLKKGFFLRDTGVYRMPLE